MALLLTMVLAVLVCPSAGRAASLTVTLNQASTQSDPAVGSPVHFTARFSTWVEGFTGSDIVTSGTAGATTAVVTNISNDTVYDIAISGMTTNGTVVVSIPAGSAYTLTNDGQVFNAASTGTDNTVTLRAFPTVTINRAAGQADPTNKSPMYYTIVFSEPVTGFTADDVSITGTASGTKTVSLSGSGRSYTAAVSGTTGKGTVVATVRDGVATGSSGFSNLASTSTDNIVVFDNTRPSVTINQATDQPDPTTSSSARFSVVFSKNVTGFTASDVVVAGTAGGSKTASVNGTGKTYTVTVSGMSSPGTVIASIPAGAAADALGNISLGSTSSDNTVTYGAYPTVTINQADSQADPTNELPIKFSVVFSQPVTGFTAGDVVVSGTAPGTRSVSVAGSGASYTVSVTGLTGSGTVSATIPSGVARNAAGFTNLASSSTDSTVGFDNLSPRATINQAAGQSDPTTLAPVLFTAVFSEPVTGFSGTDLVISGTAAGTKSVSVSGTGTTYTVSVSGMTGAGSLVATIPAGAAIDVAGNPSLASASTDNTVTFAVANSKPQVVSISPDSGALPIETPLVLNSVYRDSNGSSDIAKCQLLVNESLSASRGIFLWYDRTGNRVYLRDDGNSSWGTGFAPGSYQILQNSQCVIYLNSTTVKSVGNDLRISWSLRLRSTMVRRNLQAWMSVADFKGATQNWKNVGWYPASDISVSPGVNTISAAVARARDGDRIILAPGSYTQTEQILVSYKSLRFVPAGVVTIDCAGLNVPALEFRNSASAVQGTASAYIQIGTDAPGSGGNACGIAVYGQVSSTAYVTLNYVRVLHTNSDTAAAIRANATESYPYTTLACYDCEVLDVGQDGFSCSGLGGVMVKMICQRCRADSAGEDGFTAHQNSVFETSDCEATGGQTGFAPAFGCSWSSTNDYLHDNNTSPRRSNLYLVGGPNFNASGLDLGGVTGFHIRLAQYSSRPSVCNFDDLFVRGTVSNWLYFGGSEATGKQTINITNGNFGGLTSGNAMDDCNASEITPVIINLSSSQFVVNGANRHVIASQAGKGSLWNISNCLIQNTHSYGNGLKCMGNVSVRNSTVKAGLVKGIGITGAGYSSTSGYNTVEAKYPFLEAAAPQVGDTVTAP